MRVVMIGMEDEVYFFRTAGAEVMTVKNEREFDEIINSLESEGDMILYISEIYIRRIREDLWESLSRRNVVILSLPGKTEDLGVSGERLFNMISRAIGMNARSL